MEKGFTIKKANGTLLIRKVDASDDITISQLIKNGWEEEKPKTIKKSKKTKK